MHTDPDLPTLECESPLGPLRLQARGEALAAVILPEVDGAAYELPLASAPPAILRAAARQLDEYFAGRRTVFDLPLDARGTEFQQRVWRALCGIPFGHTRSYGELARALGRPHASRAVGAANGQNPIGIIVPCHRVIGKDGSLTGYGGGLEAKRWLLAHEGVTLGAQGSLFASASPAF